MAIVATGVHLPGVTAREPLASGAVVLVRRLRQFERVDIDPEPDDRPVPVGLLGDQAGALLQPVEVLLRCALGAGTLAGTLEIVLGGVPSRSSTSSASAPA